jgi:hypothetical protein
MWLARIMPDEPGYDLRTFECPECGHQTQQRRPGTDLVVMSRDTTVHRLINDLAEAVPADDLVGAVLDDHDQ